MREFGFVIPERPVVVDDVRVRGTGRSGLRLEDVPNAQSGPPRVDKVGGPACAAHPHPLRHGARCGWGDPGRVQGLGCSLTQHPPQVTQCFFEGGYQETPVYLLGELGYGHKLQGPCLIIDSNRWAAAWPGWSCKGRPGVTAARAWVHGGALPGVLWLQATGV